MKALFTTLFLILFLINNTVYSQSENMQVKEEIVTPVKHWVKNVEDKNYILWTVVEKYENCVYLIERSENQTEWEMIGYKDAFKSPNNIALAYYFTDEDPTEKANYYRLKRVVLLKSDGSEVNQNEVVTVKVN